MVVLECDPRAREAEAQGCSSRPTELHRESLPQKTKLRNFLTPGHSSAQGAQEGR